MKARLYKLNNFWFVVIPPENDLFSNEDIISEEYAKKYAVPIYRINDIDLFIINKWKLNQWISGNLVRERKKNYFSIDNIIYKEEKIPIINKDYKAIIAIEAILGRFTKVAITQEQFAYIKRLAEEENSVTCKFTNGFAVDYKYIIFGKINKRGEIYYPQIKIK